MANRKTQKKRVKGDVGRLGLALVRLRGNVLAVTGLSGPLATAWQRVLVRNGGRSVAWPSGFAYVFREEGVAAQLYAEAFRPTELDLEDLPEVQRVLNETDALVGALL